MDAGNLNASPLPPSSPPPAAPLSFLFVDFNAYFASVEQQLVPELRGRPVAVAPVTSNGGCCIAVSYEAKKFGVKTGTRVGEARNMCPDIVVVDARPRVYVQMHEHLCKVIGTCLPIHGVHSIDEVSCRLLGDERRPASAAKIARGIKAAIRREVGEHMRCSIGIAPNRFLAKVASDMQKPDGLTIIESHQIVEKLTTLNLIDLPGIGPRMRTRLLARGVSTVAELLACDERRMHTLWESVVGLRWHRMLRGEELDELPTHRSTIGHSHVLPPERRGDAEARAVALRLMHKAAARMRTIGYAAGRMSLSVALDTRVHGHGGYASTHQMPTWGMKYESWHGDCTFEGGCTDSFEFTRRFDQLWSRRPPGRLKQVGVVFSDLMHRGDSTLPLFAQERRHADLSKVMDEINTRFGKHAVYAGAMHDARDSAKGGIAFTYIPDITLADSVE